MNKYALLVGSALDGFAIHGPFETPAQAEAYCGRQGIHLSIAWVTTMVQPDQPRPKTKFYALMQKGAWIFAGEHEDDSHLVEHYDYMAVLDEDEFKAMARSAIELLDFKTVQEYAQL